MSGLDKDRFRNQTIGFRVSPEERYEIEARALLSGMPKGQFYAESLLNQKISISIGKYKSDRLGLEIKRLRDQLESTEACIDDIYWVLVECRALLKQVILIVGADESEELKPGDFLVKSNYSDEK